MPDEFVTFEPKEVITKTMTSLMQWLTRAWLKLVSLTSTGLLFASKLYEIVKEGFYTKE